MEPIPLEILAEIAGKLSSTSVRHFRLVSRAFAIAGFQTLMRHIQVINTVECLQRLDTLRLSPYGSLKITRHMTIYHGTWPNIASREAWDAHPLLLVGREQALDANEAYANYRQFAREELSRDVKSDANRFYKLLHGLPNIECLTISHIHAWRWGLLENAHYKATRERIWLVPIFQDLVGSLVLRMLPLLPSCPHLSTLDIQGTLDLQKGSRLTKCDKISRLYINSLITSSDIEEEVRDFLSSFPGIVELGVTVAPSGLFERTLPLCKLHWPRLSRVELANLWISEDELFGFVERHQLYFLCLRGITLLSGSWRSFFTRLRGVEPRIKFCSNGVLAAVGSAACTLDDYTFPLLESFLSAEDFPWPFDDWNVAGSIEA